MNRSVQSPHSAFAPVAGLESIRFDPIPSPDWIVQSDLSFGSDWIEKPRSNHDFRSDRSLKLKIGSNRIETD